MPAEVSPSSDSVVSLSQGVVESALPGGPWEGRGSPAGLPVCPKGKDEQFQRHNSHSSCCLRYTRDRVAGDAKLSIWKTKSCERETLSLQLLSQSGKSKHRDSAKPCFSSSWGVSSGLFSMLGRKNQVLGGWTPVAQHTRHWRRDLRLWRSLPSDSTNAGPS